jgi:hypothetical protein
LRHPTSYQIALRTKISGRGIVTLTAGSNVPDVKLAGGGLGNSRLKNWIGIAVRRHRFSPRRIAADILTCPEHWWDLEQISLGSNREDSQRFINERVCRH